MWIDAGLPMQPLGGVSNVETLITSNEDGRYESFRADGHGFNNPPGVWDLPRLDVAAALRTVRTGTGVLGRIRRLLVPRRR